MKKLLALTLALCLLCAAALANELTWDSVAETADQIAGGFKTYEDIAVKIWIPDILQETELTDEDKENGFIGYYMTADETAAVSVRYVDMNGMSLEEYEAALKDEADVSGIETGSVNGLEGLSYDIKDKDTSCIAFTTQKGYILEVACAPMSDEGFAAVAAIIISSIQAAE